MPIALCPAVSRCGLGGVLVPAVSGGGMGCVRVCQTVARPSQPINAPKTAKKRLKKSFLIELSGLFFAVRLMSSTPRRHSGSAVLQNG